MIRAAILPIFPTDAVVATGTLCAGDCCVAETTILTPACCGTKPTEPLNQQKCSFREVGHTTSVGMFPTTTVSFSSEEQETAVKHQSWSSRMDPAPSRSSSSSTQQRSLIITLRTARHFFPSSRYSCGIDLGDQHRFVIIGGQGAMRKVSLYVEFMWKENLVELNRGRYLHACSMFTNSKGNKVTTKQFILINQLDVEIKGFPRQRRQKST